MYHGTLNLCTSLSKPTLQNCNTCYWVSLGPSWFTCRTLFVMLLLRILPSGVAEPVWFWPDYFFSILVPRRTSAVKAPLYTSLKLLPLGCDVPNQAFQPTYMSFPRRERDGHGNHKAVAVKHEGTTRGHPDNWKMCYTCIQLCTAIAERCGKSGTPYSFEVDGAALMIDSKSLPQHSLVKN